MQQAARPAARRPQAARPARLSPCAALPAAARVAPPAPGTLPSAFDLLGINRAAAKASVAAAYDARARAEPDADAGYSKVRWRGGAVARWLRGRPRNRARAQSGAWRVGVARAPILRGVRAPRPPPSPQAALLARATALTAAADALLDREARLAHERGAPLAVGGPPGAAAVGALMLLQESGACAAAAAWGEALLASRRAGGLPRDTAAATALALCDAARGALEGPAADAAAAAASLARAIAVLDAAGAGGAPRRGKAAAALAELAAGPAPPSAEPAADWPHMDAREQAGAVLEALKKGDPLPVPAPSAAAALVAAGVAARKPSLIATALSVLEAPDGRGSRAGAAACALLLGDAAAAERFAGVARARGAADPRVAAFVTGVDGDPLPGLCALAEAYVGDCLRSARGGDAAAAAFTLDAWFAAPAVALRLRAGGVAGAAKRAAGRAAGGVRVALVRVARAAVAAKAAAVTRVAAAAGDDDGNTSSAAAAAAAARALATPSELTIATATALTVGDLQAAAAAADAAGWAESPVGDVAPLAGETELWAAARRPTRAVVAARLFGGAALVLAASLALPAARARVAPAARALVGRAAAPAAAATPLSPRAAASLLASFQHAKRAACGESHDAARLDTVLAGRLAAEWRHRAAELAADGWRVDYSPRGASLTSDPVFHTASKCSFDATVRERAVLRDASGAVLDDAADAYAARFVAERARSGEWRLTGARVLG